VVAGEGALAAAMATRSYWLPVAGEVKNTNRLLGIDGFVGMKTGSDSAAGGCLMFRSVWQTGAGKRSLIGVVLGQRGGHVVDAALSSARRLAVRVQSDAAATE
jgi:D-alanyl-D-alanine carboxypeptidase (penicillin-binding protein 5/6)